MPWISPITGRSEIDIFNKTQLAFAGENDWNRLEINTKHLAGLLGVDVEIKLWGIEDIQYDGEKMRILNNIRILRNVSNIFPTTPLVPKLPFNTWQAWNDAEQILFDIYIKIGGK